MKRLVVLASLVLASLTPSRAADAERPISVGMIGLDTSHVVIFAKTLNNPANTGDLAGVKVVAAFPGGNPDFPLSRDRLKTFTQQVRDTGVEIVDSIDALLSRVDVVLLESVDGSQHLEQLLPVFKARKPVFIDKPLAHNLADALAIEELGRIYGTPWFSSSSLRFQKDLQGAIKDASLGAVIGCDSFSQSRFGPGHMDLAWYGVHGVEILYTVMGRGCESVTRVQTEFSEQVTGTWSGGRVGTFRGIREHTHQTGFGTTIFAMKGISQVATGSDYGPLLDEIARFCKTRRPPVDPAVTREMFAFMAAADESKRAKGAPVLLATVIEKARSVAKRRLAGLGVKATAFDASWPPMLHGAVDGTVTVETDEFLRVPASMEARRAEKGVDAFAVAHTAPLVELAFHDQLGPDAASRRLWSSWGDICVSDDGRVYCAIGDHGNDAGGDARCFLYEWDPKAKRLRQIVDMNRVVPPRTGQPAWSKVHAKIDQGADGKIYFSCTLNAGGKAGDPKYGFTDTLPGGQLYRYDPASGRTEVFASLPPRRCTATSLLDRARNVWWCNLEAGAGDALFGLDLATRKVVFRSDDGSVGFNRAFTLLRDGRMLFNGTKTLQLLDPGTGKIESTRTSAEGSPGMRCATRESKNGHVFGMLQTTHQLFDYTVATDELKLLGPGWLAGEYTAVCELSSDERFLYYLPGSHGGAWKSGTPIVQYDIATGRRKVLAFLAPAIESRTDYVPAGTYGMKLSADGSTIFVNFNGHPADRIRPANMKPNGFGLTAFTAIHIPQSER